MDKSDNRLVQIFEELRGLNLVRTQKEMAELMEVDRTTLSSAMNGNTRVYTQSMVVRAERLRTRLLNGESTPAPTPTPKDVAIPSDLLGIIATQAETIRSQQEVIARLTGVETKKGAV